VIGAPTVRQDRRPGYVLAGTLAVLLVLTGFSVREFVSVADAHARAALDAKMSVGLLGLASNGTLADNGRVRAWLNVTVQGPSSRALRFDTVIYKLWIEDLPREAGLPVVRTDVRVQNDSFSGWFYTAYSDSNTSSLVVVPAQHEGTVALVLDLTLPATPGAFLAVQNITDFAVARGTPASEVPWLLFVLTSLYIDGVPRPESPTAAPYQTDVARIILAQGVDHGG
jgi:hypothetical protein